MNQHQILDGKSCAASLTRELELTIASLKRRKPGLAFILVGNNPASQAYVRMKKKGCAQTGIQSTLLELNAAISQSDLLTHIERFNKDPAIDGILIQLPLPSHIDEQAVMLAIDPAKDVDGFHPINVGKMLLGDTSALLPCTPHGIQVLLERNQIPVEGKHVVIIGRSNIVGKPLAAILMQKRAGCNATVTICHSQSENLAAITRSADILICALGRPYFLKADMVRLGVVVIDVGINRINGQIVGDVDFESVAPLASWITPVPGGVGPMTIAMLLKNTFKSYSHANRDL
jgi:methylenetetrahydrofolate dehydrogenase (NADP+)/methenyltetrahydrofolate cyclohydrolase